MITRITVESSSDTKSYYARLTRTFSDANTTEFRKILADYNGDNVYEYSDIYAVYEKFSYIINGAYDVAFPLIILDTIK